MAWVYLTLAGFFEIVLAIGLKYSDGFTRIGPSLVTVVGIIASMLLLGLAVKTLPIGVAYTVWTGIGAVGTVIFGLVWLGEPATMVRLVLLGVIVVSIGGLYLTSPQ